MYKLQFNNLCAPLYLDSKEKVALAIDLYRKLWGKREPISEPQRTWATKNAQEVRCPMWWRPMVVDVPPYYMHPLREENTLIGLRPTFANLVEAIDYATFADAEPGGELLERRKEYLEALGGDAEREYIANYNQHQAELRAWYSKVCPERVKEYADIDIKIR